MDVREQLRDRVLALVGNLAGEHLEEHATERVDVSARVGVASGDLLRRHVVDGADDGSLRGQAGGRVRPLGHPEVRQVGVLGAIGDGDQDVRRLDVAVHQALGVGGVERRGALREQIDRPARIERSRFTDDLAQVGADDVVHHEEHEPFLFSGVVDRDHVGVVDRRGDPHLAPEALPERRVIGQLGRQHLQRVDALQRDVRHPVDDPHAAAADQLVDPVAPDHEATRELTASRLHPPGSLRPRSSSWIPVVKRIRRGEVSVGRAVEQLAGSAPRTRRRADAEQAHPESSRSGPAIPADWQRNIVHGTSIRCQSRLLAAVQESREDALGRLQRRPVRDVLEREQRRVGQALADLRSPCARRRSGRASPRRTPAAPRCSRAPSTQRVAVALAVGACSGSAGGGFAAPPSRLSPAQMSALSARASKSGANVGFSAADEQLLGRSSR